MNELITFEEFSKIDCRVGTIIEIHDFPEAKLPAYKLTIDFGHLGLKKSSAQITTLYKKEELLNKQIVELVNFPKKQIANYMSECIVLGAVSRQNFILLNHENSVKNVTSVN